MESRSPSPTTRQGDEGLGKGKRSGFFDFGMFLKPFFFGRVLYDSIGFLLVVFLASSGDFVPFGNKAQKKAMLCSCPVVLGSFCCFQQASWVGFASECLRLGLWRPSESSNQALPPGLLKRHDLPSFQKKNLLAFLISSTLLIQQFYLSSFESFTNNFQFLCFQTLPNTPRFIFPPKGL